MATTIQISQGLQKELMERKLSDSETYEEIIWDVLEDTMEISEETKKRLKDIYRDDVKKLEELLNKELWKDI